MGDVINFARKPADEPEPETPHGAGEAFCFQCKYEWTAVAPVGTTQLQCPECLTYKGLMKFPYAPPADKLRRQCNCGNQLFYLTLEGHMCCNCGVYQSY